MRRIALGSIERTGASVHSKEIVSALGLMKLEVVRRAIGCFHDAFAVYCPRDETSGILRSREFSMAMKDPT